MSHHGNSKGQKLNLNMVLCIALETRLADGNRWKVGDGMLSGGCSYMDH
jgi:hypothetical protein